MRMPLEAETAAIAAAAPTGTTRVRGMEWAGRLEKRRQRR